MIIGTKEQKIMEEMGSAGIEPAASVLEPDILPLNYEPINNLQIKGL